MAKPKKSRTIRMDQFTKQLEDTGIDELQEVELTKDVKVYVKLGVGIDVEGTQDFMDRVGETDTEDEAALVLLDYYPKATAEEQLKKVHDAGYTSAQLIALWGAATSAMRDEMGKLRPRKS